MNDDIKFDAAVDLTVAIEKNAAFATTKHVLGGLVVGGVIYFQIGSAAVCFAASVIICLLLETRHTILQYLRRSERAMIFRERPDLFEPVKEEVAKMRADRKFWRTLNP